MINGSPSIPALDVAPVSLMDKSIVPSNTLRRSLSMLTWLWSLCLHASKNVVLLNVEALMGSVVFDCVIVDNIRRHLYRHVQVGKKKKPFVSSYG